MTTMKSNLSNEEIERYSRQLIIEKFGVEAQSKLKESSALIIGCGGLGCPSALYLSAAGIGRLGLVDHDSIDVSNIHRQIAHASNCVGKNKAFNLAQRCRELNDLVSYEVHECALEKSSSIGLISQYDVILDCTDNVITRYLINDVCVLLDKPLVSGSALKFDGQLTVYNHANSPCYRCLYPNAPPPETVSNCSDAGILGPVVGMIGSLQALEAIKVLTNVGTSLAGRMMIFDGFDLTTRTIKLRPKQVDSCLVCKPRSEKNSFSPQDIEDRLAQFDYNQFCGVKNFDDKTVAIKLLSPEERISCLDYKKIIDEDRPSHLLIDTRPKCQFQICSLPNSMNIPFDEFQNNFSSIVENVKERLEGLKSSDKSIFVVCRRGNDSQLAVDLLKKHFSATDNSLKLESIKDLIGGLQEWTNSVDPNFPKY